MGAELVFLRQVVHHHHTRQVLGYGFTLRLGTPMPWHFNLGVWLARRLSVYFRLVEQPKLRFRDLFR